MKTAFVVATTVVVTTFVVKSVLGIFKRRAAEINAATPCPAATPAAAGAAVDPAEPIISEALLPGVASPDAVAFVTISTASDSAPKLQVSGAEAAAPCPAATLVVAAAVPAEPAVSAEALLPVVASPDAVAFATIDRASEDAPKLQEASGVDADTPAAAATLVVAAAVPAEPAVSAEALLAGSDSSDAVAFATIDCASEDAKVAAVGAPAAAYIPLDPESPFFSRQVILKAAWKSDPEGGAAVMAHLQAEAAMNAYMAALLNDLALVSEEVKKLREIAISNLVNGFDDDGKPVDMPLDTNALVLGWGAIENAHDFLLANSADFMSEENVGKLCFAAGGLVRLLIDTAMVSATDPCFWGWVEDQVLPAICDGEGAWFEKGWYLVGNDQGQQWWAPTVRGLPESQAVLVPAGAAVDPTEPVGAQKKKRRKGKKRGSGILKRNARAAAAASSHVQE